eukprot:c32559_g1_i1 orf=116-310(+)
MWDGRRDFLSEILSPYDRFSNSSKTPFDVMSLLEMRVDEFMMQAIFFLFLFLSVKFRKLAKFWG